MNNWRRQRGENHHHQEIQGTARSRYRKPPHHGSWQRTVPSWEKRFCYLVGSIPWRKLLETKRSMYLFENVVQWNDSAGEEAFRNAKNRFWAEMNGLPCNISLPDPDIYIDEIDWNSNVDPELLLDLEQEPKDPDETSKGEDVVIIDSSLLLNQPFSCTGWGGAEEEFQKIPDSALDPRCHGYENHWESNGSNYRNETSGWGNYEASNDKNPWERNAKEASKDGEWGNWGNDCNGWNDWKNVDEGNGGEWGTWDGRGSGGWHMTRYKTSEEEWGMDGGLWRRHGRGRRRVHFVY